jgi:hypothetical protein
MVEKFPPAGSTGLMLPKKTAWATTGSFGFRNPEGNKSANIAPDSGTVFVRQSTVHIEIFAVGCRAENESEDKQDCGFISFLVPQGAEEGDADPDLIRRIGGSLHHTDKMVVSPVDSHLQLSYAPST